MDNLYLDRADENDLADEYMEYAAYDGAEFPVKSMRRAKRRMKTKKIGKNRLNRRNTVWQTNNEEYEDWLTPMPNGKHVAAKATSVWRAANNPEGRYMLKSHPSVWNNTEAVASIGVRKKLESTDQAKREYFAEVLELKASDIIFDDGLEEGEDQFEIAGYVWATDKLV